jgi:hypothetical protein
VGVPRVVDAGVHRVDGRGSRRLRVGASRETAARITEPATNRLQLIGMSKLRDRDEVTAGELWVSTLSVSKK